MLTRGLWHAGAVAGGSQGRKARKRSAAAAKREARPEPKEEGIDEAAERERMRVRARTLVPYHPNVNKAGLRGALFIYTSRGSG